MNCNTTHYRANSSSVPGDPTYRVPDCDYEGIVEAYGAALAMLPQVALLTAARRSHMQARWREVCAAEKLDRGGALDYFRSYFGHVSRSPFLTGAGPPRKGGERAWRADLDWLMNPTNFAKVIEGNYHRQRATA